MASSIIFLTSIQEKFNQKTSRGNENSSSSITLEKKVKEISSKDYGKIEQIIRAISAPYDPLPKPISLADMTEILDDIWEEDD